MQGSLALVMEKVLRPDRKLEPFIAVEALDYRDRYSREEWLRIKQGFQPRSMDDKWIIFEEDGTLFFHRSWTGQAFYRVYTKPSWGGRKVTKAEVDLHHMPPSKMPLTVVDQKYYARLLRWMVRSFILDQSLPFPRLGVDSGGLEQHAVAGTGGPEIQHGKSDNTG